MFVWKYADGCEFCEEAKKVPKPWPWYVWCLLAMVLIWPIGLSLQDFRSASLNKVQMFGTSAMLSCLLAWLSFLLLRSVSPRRVDGYELIIGLKRVSGNDYFLHSHLSHRPLENLAVYVTDVPVSFWGLRGKAVDLMVYQVRPAGVHLPGSWFVRMPPTGRVCDARLHSADVRPPLAMLSWPMEKRRTLSFSIWGDLLYVAFKYKNGEEFLGCADRMSQLKKGHEVALAEKETSVRDLRARFHDQRVVVAMRVEQLSRTLGRPMLIPVDRDPFPHMEAVSSELEIALVALRASVKESGERQREAEEKVAQVYLEIEEAVSQLAESMEIEFEGEGYTPTRKLVHASMHAAELFPEQRLKITSLTTRAKEAEALSLLLGHSMMILRLWMAEDVNIRSQLFAAVRRFFQEVVTPQVLEHERGKDLLLKWYEDIASVSSDSPLNSLPKQALYRGDFDDIIGAPAIHRPVSRQISSTGQSRGTRRRGRSRRPAKLAK